ncbi:MAG: LptF/LptG family permease [Bacteroidales bacterium]|nr:LptF/LptG family permease [Bacteroidales bacterium]MCF8334866.1 LptF/LptG family permease [Bacteroidales bacterium]
MKLIDIYIIKKFLGTFIYAISLLAVIIIVFDISEKTDEFVENNAPLSEIIFSYYANFLPYFINLFSALFTFIAVIFFTSKMAYNTEIIAILSNGISFRRMLRPFLISSVLIGMASFLLSNFVIPDTNEEMMDFQWEYLKSERKVENRNIHMKIASNTHIYVETYNADRDIGRKFAMEKFKEGKLVSKITSDYIKWQPEKKSWEVHNYIIRHIDGTKEELRRGPKLDTVISLSPKDFVVHKDDLKTMDWGELRDFIAKEKMKGSSNVLVYEVEKHKRIAFPFANIILTMIGVALSSRKVRGGIGMHLGIGLLLTFSYILFMQVSSVFSTYGGLDPFVAVWIPNITYAIISLFLIKTAPK